MFPAQCSIIQINRKLCLHSTVSVFILEYIIDHLIGHDVIEQYFI